jgi:uncharacterized protein YukE
MTSLPAFPRVETGAMAECASRLQSLGSQMADIGTDVSAIQQAVASSEQWQGEAASRWQQVVTSRVSDANLTDEVLGKASSLLQQLATGLQEQRQAYNKARMQMEDQEFVNGSGSVPPPPDWDEGYIAAMKSAASQASELLHQAGNDFLTLASLAGDITATTARDRMPGVGPGTNRSKASLNLLDQLWQVAVGGISDSGFEKTVLAELNLSKNTSTVRGLIPGKTSPGTPDSPPQPKGIIPDSLDENPNGYVVEIKGYTSEVQFRSQIQAEAQLASQDGVPYWVIVQNGATVSPRVIQAAEGTGGGVLVRTGANTYTNLNGQPVNIGQGMKVTDYKPVMPNQGTSDPQAPSDPVNPSDTGPEPADPGGPGDPGGGGDPDPDPFPIPPDIP